MSPLLLRCGALVLALLLAGGAYAQSTHEAERKLETLRKELKSVAQERRKLEDARGDASRKLREMDVKVGKSSRALAETETSLRRETESLAQLQQRRGQMQQGLAAQREQLALLLRAAYTLGENAPLKLLLAQDRVADANRALAYHRYVQRERTQQIQAITGQLKELDSLEQEIGQRREQLDATRRQQQMQASALEKDRKSRAQVVSELDEKYRDRSQREKALGQDARALEKLLASLRAAAARAESARRAAAQRERAAAGSQSSGAKTPPKVVASAPPLKVGGLGWPLSGNLLARYGGKLPDGRSSAGVLIGAPAGSVITAVADGTVVFSDWMTGYGMILIIDHGNGYMSLYAHNDALLRDAGSPVKRGEPVAKVGNSGGQGVSALYFELRRNGQPVDPSSWLQRR